MQRKHRYKDLMQILRKSMQSEQIDPFQTKKQRRTNNHIPEVVEESRGEPDLQARCQNISRI